VGSSLSNPSGRASTPLWLNRFRGVILFLALLEAFDDPLDRTRPLRQVSAHRSRIGVMDFGQQSPVFGLEQLDRRRWWEELAANWSETDEFQVYRRVAAAIRALAKAGRAIIVGRGGVYATSDLPGGIHLRLVVPTASRIAHMAAELKVSPEAAALQVRRLDRDRDAFHRRHSPGKTLLPEIFTITLNAASLSDDQMISCVLPLVRPQPCDAASGQTDAASGRLPAGTEVT
jgi:hypothetical protein